MRDPQLRQFAIERAHAGLPLGAEDMALIFNIGVSWFHKQHKLGVYDDFLLRPALGPKRFSGELVSRYLRGEVVDAPPASRFGRTRRAS